jgi:hypothetical protein
MTLVLRQHNQQNLNKHYFRRRINNQLQEIPLEVICQIFDFLPQSTIIHHVSLLNRTYYHLVYNCPLIWMNRKVKFTFRHVDSIQSWQQYRQEVERAFEMTVHCRLTLIQFNYLLLEDLLRILLECHESLILLQVQSFGCSPSSCSGTKVIVNDEIDKLLIDLIHGVPSFPMLQRIQLGYYLQPCGTGSNAEIAETIILQLLTHVISCSPNLKCVNAMEVSLFNFHSIINWDNLTSVTLLFDHKRSNLENNYILAGIAPRLANNLTYLDLRAQNFDHIALGELLRHVSKNLTRLDVYDLLFFPPITSNSGIKLDKLKELSVFRSERAVCNLVRVATNLESLQLDRSSSYEIVNVAASLKNLKHLALERYSPSLTQIMRHCSLHTLKISYMEMDQNLIQTLIDYGQSIQVLVMDHVKFSKSEDVELLMGKLSNVKELTMNVCHSTSFRNSSSVSSGTSRVNNPQNRIVVFNYRRCRMDLDVSCVATPMLRSLTYQKAVREKIVGIRMDEFHLLTQQCPRLSYLDVSLFDVSFATNSNYSRFDVFPELETCRLVFGEYASLAQICCVLICCRNATNFIIDSITCKTPYIDSIRAQLLSEIPVASIRTARPTTIQPSPLKKLKRGSDQRIPKPKKSSHSRKGTCNLTRLAKIVWNEMDTHVFTKYQFYCNNKNITEELRKHYKAELLLQLNSRWIKKDTSLLHHFLHMLQFRVLSKDIPKKMLTYGSNSSSSLTCNE